jgi:hypothetical protein
MTTVLLIVVVICLVGIWLALADVRRDLQLLLRGLFGPDKPRRW